MSWTFSSGGVSRCWHTAHMFSLEHCIFFQCIMNGSNHLEESDSRAFALCPVCLRKLQSSIGLDVAARYRGVSSFSRKRGLHFEAQWVENRLKWILADEEPREHS